MKWSKFTLGEYGYLWMIHVSIIQIIELIIPLIKPLSCYHLPHVWY